MAKKIRAIILDKDGVFVDFAKLWGTIISYRAQTIAENALCSSDGFETIKNDCMMVMGLDPKTDRFDPFSPGSCMPFDHVKIALASSLFTNMKKLNSEFTWHDALKVIDDSTDSVRKAYKIVDHSEPIAGSIEKIQEISKAGYRLGVLTSDTEANAMGALEKFKIDKLFFKVQGGKKKTPELYKELCAKLGVLPEETIMFGDTPMELKSAKECGAMAVGLLSGVVDENNKAILEEHADFILAALADFDLSSLGDSTHEGNNTSEQQKLVVSANKQDMLDTNTVVIFSDGASRGNPGEASVGAVLEEGGNVVKEISNVLGIATNNEAEYQALIAGLEAAIEMNYKKVIANADSELMVKQLKGDYKVKSSNMRPLYQRVKELEAQFDSVEYKHVTRANNWVADKLANEALDQAML